MSFVTLHLTSPNMTDASVSKMGGERHQVTALQVMLKRYGVDPGVADGQYGIHTARAVQRAKVKLGYLKTNEVAGARLVGYLRNPASRSLAMKALAAKRAAAARRKAARVPKRVKALHWLGGKLGMTEHPPGSNRCDASLWYGLIGPWCAMVGSESGVAVGQKSFAKGQRYAYCPYVTADAVAGRNGLSVTHDPQPGDRVIFTWGGSGSNPLGDHFGTFIEWIVKGVSFKSREGNTSREGDASGSQSNGGILCDRVRYVSNVVHFVRVAE